MSVKIQFNIEDEEFGCEHSICMDNAIEFNANQVNEIKFRISLLN